MVDAAFGLTSAAVIDATVRIENAASRRVLEKAGFAHVGRGLRGAPARGAMVESDTFALKRVDWAARAEAHPLEAAS